MAEQIIYSLQDLTYLSWDKIRNSSGTAGSFLKAYSELNHVKTYYKLSNFDAYRGIVGHECVNEIIVDRLLTTLSIPHLQYQLIHARILIDNQPFETWLCASQDFKQRSESKIALDDYYQAERTPGESPLDFCIRNGWENYIYQMLVIDYLILNRDRHGANIEVLRNSRQKTLRLAPLFDHGLSLLFNCMDEVSLAKADVMEDKPVNNFIGSRSTLENLKLIPADKRPPVDLTEQDISALTMGLEPALSSAWLDKMMEMIRKRVKAYANFCNQR